MKPVETQLANAVLINRARVRPNPQNPRELYDPAKLAELGATIKANGLLQPLVVRYDPSRYDATPYVITAGHRRYFATENILEDLPCIISNASRDETQELALIENIHREDLTAWEEAKAVRDLMTAQNLSALAVARRLKKSSGWVNNRLALLKTKPDVQKVAAKAPLAMSSLLMIDGVKDSELRSELLHQVESGAAHSEIKSRIELHNRPKQKEFTDAETQSRANEYSRNGTPNVSRGRRVTGTKPSQAQAVVLESLASIDAKLNTIDDWIETLTDAQRAKLTPRFRQLSKRLERLAD